MDISSIPGGGNIEDTIDHGIASCEVVIVLIGDKWLTLKDDAGRTRIFQPEDPCQREIRAAIDHGIPIIPVLVGFSNKMAKPDDLPSSISVIANLNAMEVRSTTFFNAGFERLLTRLRDLGIPPNTDRPLRPPKISRIIASLVLLVGLIYLLPELEDIISDGTPEPDLPDWRWALQVSSDGTIDQVPTSILRTRLFMDNNGVDYDSILVFQKGTNYKFKTAVIFASQREADGYRTLFDNSFVPGATVHDLSSWCPAPSLTTYRIDGDPLNIYDCSR